MAVKADTGQLFLKLIIVFKRLWGQESSAVVNNKGRALITEAHFLNLTAGITEYF